MAWDEIPHCSACQRKHCSAFMALICVWILACPCFAPDRETFFDSKNATIDWNSYCTKGKCKPSKRAFDYKIENAAKPLDYKIMIHKVIPAIRTLLVLESLRRSSSATQWQGIKRIRDSQDHMHTGLGQETDLDNALLLGWHLGPYGLRKVIKPINGLCFDLLWSSSTSFMFNWCSSNHGVVDNKNGDNYANNECSYTSNDLARHSFEQPCLAYETALW